MKENNKTSDKTGTVLEMVSYKIKPEHLKSLPESLDAARQELMAMKGFIGYKTMKNTKQSDTFIDLVEWESLSAAEDAANKVMTTAGFKKFGEAIEEVITFSHFSFFH